MEKNLEQRYAIKFCVKLGKTATETLEMIKDAFKDAAMSRSTVFEWHKLFREGRELVEDDQRAGRPSTSRIDENVAKVKVLLDSNRRTNIRLVVDELGISYGSVQKIITEDLAMRKVCAKFVPRVLSNEQKVNRKQISQEILNCVQRNPNFFDNVITGDETWCFEYDPETKRQSTEWHTKNSPRPKKAKMNKSRIKSMLICFFDRRGVVHREFVPPGQTMNATFYVNVLDRLRKRILRVRPDIADSWKLHHDNAPCHTALLVREFLANHRVATLPHPPYSPDIAPADFFLFPRLKRDLKGNRFSSVENIQGAVTASLKGISEREFQKAYEQWESRYTRCVEAQGCYFEDY